ncbi:MAG: cyclase family protein [Thermomicrobiales bacterium]
MTSPLSGSLAGLESVADALTKAELIDLTVTLAERSPPVWPTHMPFQRKDYNWYASRSDQVQPIHRFRGPYHTAWLTLDEHCGTHFDPPAHFTPPPDSGLPHANECGLQSGDKIELGRLMGPAAVIDVSELTDTGEPGVGPEILPEHIQRWEAEHGELREDEIVLYRSDWDRHYVDMPDGAAYITSSFVLQRDPSWPTPDEPAHFMFLPVKIEGSSGGPGRAIAFVPRG